MQPDYFFFFKKPQYTVVEKVKTTNSRPKPNKNTLSKVKNPAMLLNKKKK